MPEGSLTLPARAESLAAALDFLRSAALEAKIPERRAQELDLIAEEILMNLSRYAYPEDASGEAVITYSIPAPQELHIEFADQGREFNPLAAPEPDLKLDLTGRPIGGLGIFLIRSYAKSLSYRREMGWNRLTFAISAES